MIEENDLDDLQTNIGKQQVNDSPRQGYAISQAGKKGHHPSTYAGAHIPSTRMQARNRQAHTRAQE